NPGWLNVQAEDDSDPSVGAALTVMVNVPALVAPAASRTLTLTVLKVPVAVGVPLTVTVLPLSDALRPAGRPRTVRWRNGPVRPGVRMGALKAGWLTVHAEDDSEPSAGVGLIVTLNVPVPVAPVKSRTVTWTLPNVPAAVGVPVKTTFDPLTVALRPG